MRISDCSSDVCSSVLPDDAIQGDAVRQVGFIFALHIGGERVLLGVECAPRIIVGPPCGQSEIGARGIEPVFREEEIGVGRSEEHTSELQSLMRSSYAVFCLKKKKIK